MDRPPASTGRLRPRAPAGWSPTLLLATAVALWGRAAIATVWPDFAARAPGPWPLALALALVVARWWRGLPEGRERARSAREQGRGTFAQVVSLLVPAEGTGLLACVGGTLRGFVAAVLRLPPPPRPAGRPIEDRRKGMYDAVFVLNLLSFVVEVPLMALLVRGAAVAAGLQVALHVVEAALVVFIVGDWWQVRAGGHVLTTTHLDLRAGLRASARVPLPAIERIEPVPRPGGPWAWRQANGVRRREAGTVSVLDTPNLAITLRAGEPGDELRWTRFQVERPMPRHLLVYVDDPAAVAAAVREAASHLH